MARIAIVGAGAKAAAIVTRAATLRALGVAGVPELLVFEADHVGAARSGQGAFTSGFPTLCTPGEKDVGFPYLETFGLDPPVATALFARFSWAAYLVAEGRMADWVDRGREHPSHARWADYLDWVFDRAGQSFIRAHVTKARRGDGAWEVVFAADGEVKVARVDGVVLTGNGQAKTVPRDANVPADRIFDAETFWAARKMLLELKEGAIAVVGDGGAAGTIVAWLAEHFAERQTVSIVSVNPMGTLFPRGDGHSERRWFSDPSDWRTLTIEHRRKLLDRTEAGVVSTRIKDRIDKANNFIYRPGRAIRARWTDDEIALENMTAAPPRQ